jgi:antitoxin VapB
MSDCFTSDPRGLELEGDAAVVQKEGDRLIVKPYRKEKLLTVLARMVQ